MKQIKKSSKKNTKLASLLIRIGLALVFIYAAFSAFTEPNAWISYIPEFSNKFVEPAIALNIISVLQIILAVWLISGRYLKYSAIASAGLLAGIMIFNPETFIITFRDVGLVFAAISLIFLND